MVYVSGQCAFAIITRHDRARGALFWLSSIDISTASFECRLIPMCGEAEHEQASAHTPADSRLPVLHALVCT